MQTPFFWTVTPPVFFLGKEMGGVVLPPAGGIFFLAKRQELLYAYMHNVKPYG